MFCQLKGFLSANCQSQVPLWVGVLFMKSGVPRGLVIGPLLFTLIHLTSFRQTLVSLLMILKCILLSRHLRIPTGFKQTQAHSPAISHKTYSVAMRHAQPCISVGLAWPQEGSWSLDKYCTKAQFFPSLQGHLSTSYLFFFTRWTYVYVRPHLKYYASIWSPSLAKEIDALEKVQNCATTG